MNLRRNFYICTSLIRYIHFTVPLIINSHTMRNNDDFKIPPEFGGKTAEEELEEFLNECPITEDARSWQCLGAC